MSRKRANVPPRDDWPAIQQAVRDLQAQIDRLTREQGSQPSVPNTSDVVREVLGLLNTTTTAPGTTAGLSFGIPPVPIGSTLSEGTALNPARADHVHTITAMGCRVGVGTQSIPDSTPTDVLWTAETFDTDTMHDLVTNTNRLTFTHAGTYVVGFYAQFAANVTGHRRGNINLYDSGGVLVTVVSSHSHDAVGTVGAVTPISVNGIYRATAGQYATMEVVQTSGGALNVVAGNAWAYRLGD